MTSRNDSSKTFDRFLIILAVMGALTVGLALVAALRAPAAPASSDTPPAESANTVTATIELSEWAIEGDLTIPAGDVTIELANVGAMVHNLAFEDGKVSQDVNPGETVAFHVGELEAGTYVIYCAIAGHREAGMEATLVVTEPDGEAGSHDSRGNTGGETVGGHSDHLANPEEADAMMMESMLAFPAETEGKGNQILEPTEILDDGTKVFDLVAQIIDWEVAPGEIVEGWA